MAIRVAGTVVSPIKISLTGQAYLLELSGCPRGTVWKCKLPQKACLSEAYVSGLAVNSVRAFMNTCSRSLFTIPIQI